MKRNILIILAVILAISSCEQAATTEASKPVAIKHPPVLTSIKKIKALPNNAIDTAWIDFGDFKVLVPDIEVYQSDSVQVSDTIEISPELGYDLDSQIVIIRSKANIKSITVFECYKTVLSITNEGPHFDLYDWKGFESEWTRVKPLQKNQFMMNFISEKEASEFPSFTKEELIDEAEKTHKGAGDILKKPSYGTWKDHYWIGVGIRRLKFVLTDTDGKTFNKYLVAYMPMGC